MGVTIFVAAVCAVFAGTAAAISAALGGLVCVLPNAWFAWRLWRGMQRPGGARVTDFFIGEAMKMGLALLLMGAVVKAYPALVWPAFLAGLVVALKSYWFGLLLKKPSSSL